LVSSNLSSSASDYPLGIFKPFFLVFWLPPWYLQTFLPRLLITSLVSSNLSSSASDYPLGIFKPFFLVFWLPPWYLQTFLPPFPFVCIAFILLLIMYQDRPFTGISLLAWVLWDRSFNIYLYILMSELSVIHDFLNIILLTWVGRNQEFNFLSIITHYLL
jgi:hypothetical protein